VADTEIADDVARAPEPTVGLPVAPAPIMDALERAHAAGALRDRHVDAIIRILDTPETAELYLTLTRDGAEIGRTHVVVLSSPCGSTARILSLYMERGERLTLADVRTLMGKFLEVFPDTEEFVANRWRGWGRPTEPVWISTKPVIRARARRMHDPDAARRSIGANGGPPLEVELAY
jgi:hypothetical protein